MTTIDVDANLRVEFEPYPGYVASFVAPDAASEHELELAGSLELNAMTMLGDRSVKADFIETLGRSGLVFIALTHSPENYLGVLRYMLPKSGDCKTFRDVAKQCKMPVGQVEELFVEQAQEADRAAIDSELSVIDASALSPDVLLPKREILKTTEALLGTSAIIGLLMYLNSDRTHVVGNLHATFRAFAGRKDYNFIPITDEQGDPIASFEGKGQGFTPVYKSLQNLLYTVQTSQNAHQLNVKSALTNLDANSQFDIASKLLVVSNM